MADLEIDVRSALTYLAPPGSGTPSSADTTGTSDPDTANGDYILVVAGVDYRSAAQVTIANSTGVVNLDGDAGWYLVADASDGSSEQVKAWLGKATSSGAKSVTVNQATASSGMQIAVLTLNPNGGEITRDGAAAAITDKTSPYTHTSVTASGTKDLLVVAHAGITFAGAPIQYDSAPSGMSSVQAYFDPSNGWQGMQVCYQKLTASGATGTRNQTSTPTTLSDGGCGVRFALRSQGTAPATGPVLVQTYTGEQTASPSTISTPSFTPVAGEYIVVKAVTGDYNSIIGPPSGGGLSYHNHFIAAEPNYCRARIDYAEVGSSPSSMSVSLTTSGSSGNYYPTLIVERWSGGMPGGASVVNWVGPQTTDMSTVITTEGADSVLTWVGADWRPVTTGTPAYRSGAVSNYSRRTAGINVWSATQAAATPGSQTIGMTAPAAQKWTMLALEMRTPFVPPEADYSDRVNQSFSGGSKSSTYHIFAEDIDPEEPVGLLMYFHGDGAFDYTGVVDYPDDYYAIRGPLGVAEQGRSRNLITVVPKSPDTTGEITWWESGSDNADYAKALYDHLVDEYSIDTSKVWLTGFSGGAQFVTQFLLPKYPTMCTGGGSIVFGGGGVPISPSNPTFSSGLKADFPMVWYTGQDDLPANSPGEGYDGHGEAVDGADWYRDNGFTVYTDYPENVDHTDLEYKFGPVIGYYMERIGWGQLSTQTEYNFNSGTQYTSGNWTRVTSNPTPYEGSGALKSAAVNQNNGGNSDATFAVPSGALGMRFRYWIESEEYADFLEVAVDGQYQQMASGLSPYGWSESAPYDVSGASTVTFRYSRDEGGGQGGNAAWIDAVRFEYTYEAPTGPEPGRMLLAC